MTCSTLLTYAFPVAPLFVRWIFTFIKHVKFSNLELLCGSRPKRQCWDPSRRLHEKLGIGSDLSDFQVKRSE